MYIFLGAYVQLKKIQIVVSKVDIDIISQLAHLSKLKCTLLSLVKFGHKQYNLFFYIHKQNIKGNIDLTVELLFMTENRI